MENTEAFQAASPTPSEPIATSAKTSSQKRTRETMASEDHGEEEDGTSSKKSKRGPKSDGQRQRKKSAHPTLKGTIIPRSVEEMTDADNMMMEMRHEGSPWKVIKEAVEKKFGVLPADSTLPNRYARLMQNLALIEESHKSALMEAKVEVEAVFEAGKWDQIADNVEKRVGRKYEGEVLKRQYKKLMLQAGVAPPPGVESKDFEGNSDLDDSMGDGDDEDDA